MVPTIDKISIKIRTLDTVVNFHSFKVQFSEPKKRSRTIERLKKFTRPKTLWFVSSETTFFQM